MRLLLSLAAVALAALASAARADAPATLRVRLPADARLTIDGAPTRSTSDLRLFRTPPLEEGKEFHYVLKAVFMEAGETKTVEKTVAVRAGEETVVSLGVVAPAAFETAARPRIVPAVVEPPPYFPDPDRNPNVASMSDQDPMQWAGPPGSLNAWGGPLPGR